MRNSIWSWHLLIVNIGIALEIPLCIKSYLTCILEILRSSTSLFKAPGCWESKMISLILMEIFNKVFVKDVSGLSGNRERLSKKAVSDGSVLQEFFWLPPTPGSSTIPIASVFLGLIPSEQPNWYFCWCSILAKPDLTGVLWTNRWDISQ